jgi:hypothetical protein
MGYNPYVIALFTVGLAKGESMTKVKVTFVEELLNNRAIAIIKASGAMALVLRLLWNMSLLTNDGLTAKSEMDWQWADPNNEYNPMDLSSERMLEATDNGIKLTVLGDTIYVHRTDRWNWAQQLCFKSLLMSAASISEWDVEVEEAPKGRLSPDNRAFKAEWDRQ